jgi:hypothetical protein
VPGHPDFPTDDGQPALPPDEIGSTDLSDPERQANLRRQTLAVHFLQWLERTRRIIDRAGEVDPEILHHFEGYRDLAVATAERMPESWAALMMLRYGFGTAEPLPMAEVAHALGLSPDRMDARLDRATSEFAKHFYRGAL